MTIAQPQHRYEHLCRKLASYVKGRIWLSTLCRHRVDIAVYVLLELALKVTLQHAFTQACSIVQGDYDNMLHTDWQVRSQCNI